MAGETSRFRTGLDKICGPEANGKVSREGCPPSPPRVLMRLERKGPQPAVGVVCSPRTASPTGATHLRYVQGPTPSSKAAYNKITCQ